MRNYVLRMALVTMLVCCVPLANAGKPPVGGTTASGYTARTLGVLSEDTISRAWGVSDAGSVVGESVHFVPVIDGAMRFQRAFYWSPGTGMLALPTRVSANGTERQSIALAVVVGATGSEFAVGQQDRAGPVPHAVIWKSAPDEYAVPLEGIQIKIRTFQPESRQVREVTVVEKLK